MYERIRKLLEQRGETFADLSRGTGILQSTLSNFKARNSTLSVQNVLKVARYFGITVEELMEEDR